MSAHNGQADAGVSTSDRQTVATQLWQSWGRMDEREMEQRRRANRNRGIMLVALGSVLFCGIVSLMLGAPQSYAAQSLTALPQYPGAQLVNFRNGLDCPVTLGVYCYNYTYRTSDPPEKVIAYYEGLSRPGFMPKVKFASQRNGRFLGDYYSSATCFTVLGHRSCAELALIPKESGTEISYLETGYPGELMPVDDSQ